MALALLGTVEKAITYISLIPVMAGIVLATGFEPSFNSFGFLAAMGACCARAFKAVLQVSSAVIVCNKQTRCPHGIASLLCASPSSSCCVCVDI